MKLWLVRHAQPLIAAGVCYGANDVAADARATAQAAQALAEVLPKGIPVRCSPLQRCEQLSTILCGLRTDLIHKTDPRIAEMDFGSWEGRRWAEIPQTELDAWVNDFPHHRPGGGENVQAFLQRVQAALAEERATAAGQAVWITHAGVSRALRLLAQGIELPRQAAQWPREAPGFGAWEVLDLPLGEGRAYP